MCGPSSKLFKTCDGAGSEVRSGCGAIIAPSCSAGSTQGSMVRRWAWGEVGSLKSIAKLQYDAITEQKLCGGYGNAIAWNNCHKGASPAACLQAGETSGVTGRTVRAWRGTGAAHARTAWLHTSCLSTGANTQLFTPPVEDSFVKYRLNSAQQCVWVNLNLHQCYQLCLSRFPACCSPWAATLLELSSKDGQSASCPNVWGRDVRGIACWNRVCSRGTEARKYLIVQLLRMLKLETVVSPSGHWDHCWVTGLLQEISCWHYWFDSEQAQLSQDNN